MTDLSRARANALVQKVLGPRAYVDKRNGKAALWVSNRDRALNPAFEGPLLAACGQDYRELVRKAEARDLFEETDSALARHYQEAARAMAEIPPPYSQNT